MTLAAACGPTPEGVDLVRSKRAWLAEAWAAGLDPHEVQSDVGKPRRIRDVVRASIPAAPPSRFRFVAEVPEDGRLVLAAGIPDRHHRASAVEFVVNVRARGRDKTVLSELVDPANRPADRSWVPLEADLSEHAGNAVEIVLETRGFETSEAPDRAFWGTPTITTARDAGAPLVVVYLVDTLRADHLPIYGYARDTAPELTRLARDGVVFEQAIAPSSWTRPSVASLFTSLLPRDHGCVLFSTPLDPSLVTLAERLRGRGYATGAVVVNPGVGTRNMHFDQGFGQFEVLARERRAGPVVDAALAFLDARRGQPAFVYVHTMDVHAPYRPPPPFDRRFPPHPDPGSEADDRHDYREPGDLARIVGQYDGAIAYGDQEFGRFVRGLRERGLYERATIVFLSDHGEEFLDHGGWEHGHALFDELVRVPLVVKYPRARDAGRRVARQVQIVDVLPTILKSQRLPVPRGIVGRPLEESFGATGPERPAVLETTFFEHAAAGARTSEAKYVRQFRPAGAELFFDLRRDPAERRRREAQGSSRGSALKRLVEASLSPGFHHRVRVDGAADYDLRLRTTGWIEVVERSGLLPGDGVEVADGGRTLVLSLRPEGDRPRPVEVEFVTRPNGAAFWIDGARGGRRLRPSEIRVTASGTPARRVPFLVPDVEELASAAGPPPPATSGVSVWLVPPRSGHGFQPLGRATRESLRALGYLD